MEKKRFNLRTVIPLATIVVSLVFIIVGLKDYGFWKGQPTPGFFPIIIAVVLLASSIACFLQIARDKDSETVQYNRNELMVMLGAAGIILCTFIIGLVPSCLIYIFLWLKFVEHASWKVIVIIELIMAAIILGVFTFWLQIRFPMGLLLDMIL
nr:tripartite tricarboxylate transporter TctB family protein [uncultured Oscillibacter sp.]